MPLKSLRFRFSLFFIILLICTFILWKQQSKLIDESKNELLKNETLSFVETILPSYTLGNLALVKDYLKKAHYSIASKMPSDYLLLFEREDKILSIKIFKTKNEVGFLLHYFDEDFIATKQIYQDFWEKYHLHLLLLPIILIFLAFQVVFFFLLDPLNRISKAIKEFAKGNYDFKLQTHREDEIGDLMRSFSDAQHTIARMIKSRELILRSLGHELKTPLAKIKLLLALKPEEMSADEKFRLIAKYTNDLQKITENILEFERVNSGKLVIETKEFSIETLILQALETFDNDKDLISIDIQNSFFIKSDLRLLKVVTRNLIDNALKYSENKQIFIKTYGHRLEINNKGEPLQHSLNYYLEPFYRGSIHQSISGYGLGLSIINETLKILGLKLEYSYHKGHHCFSLDFSSAVV